MLPGERPGLGFISFSLLCVLFLDRRTESAAFISPAVLIPSPFVLLHSYAESEIQMKLCLLLKSSSKETALDNKFNYSHFKALGQG